MKKLTWHKIAAEHKRVGTNQRKFFESVAVKIEKSEPLDERERICAAGAIRAFVSSIPLEPKRKRGQAPRVQYSDIAIEFVLMREKAARAGKKLSRNRAIDLLAEKHEVSDRTIKNALKECEAAACALLGVGKQIKK